VIDEELTGNYKADRDEKEGLFEGMLLRIDYRAAEVREL
jgi:hypothetical protein